MSEPAEFLCPISKDLMRDPVFCADGYVYDRIHITNWLERNETSPMTREYLHVSDMVEHRRLREKIKNWCADAGQNLEPPRPRPSFSEQELAQMEEIRSILETPDLQFYHIGSDILSKRVRYDLYKAIWLRDRGFIVMHSNRTMEIAVRRQKPTVFILVAWIMFAFFIMPLRFLRSNFFLFMTLFLFSLSAMHYGRIVMENLPASSPPTLLTQSTF
jgi:hypothetical protein